MAKFILTNFERERVSAINEVANKNGITWAEVNNNLIATYTYEKICSPHNNYYCSEDGDFCIIVGTWIYKGQTGEETIHSILSEFTPDKIGQLKHDIIGMWSAVLSKNNEIYIFNDYYGLYDVCYFINETQLVVGTLLHEVAQIAGQNTFDEMPFMMEAFQDGAFPQKSLYKGISKLLGKEYLLISQNGDKCSKVEIIGLNKSEYKLFYHYQNEETAVSDITMRLKEVATDIDRLFGRKGMFLTGGLDSRLVFAVYNSVGASMVCKYGQGNGSQEGDRKIVEQLCKSYNKELEILDWSPYTNTEKDDDEVFSLIGYSNWIANGSKKHIDGFRVSAIKEPFFAFGYFCEAIRLRDWAETKGDSFSLDDYVDNYYINAKLSGVYDNYIEYRKYIYNGLYNQLRSIGYEGDVNRIPIDFFERFRWEMSRFCDSRAEFMLNTYSYAFSLLSVPFIHELVLSLPANVIRGARFQIKVIANIDRTLLDVNVFSHLRPYKVTKGLKKKRLLSMKSLADDVFKFLPFIKPVLVHFYRNKRYGVDDVREKYLNDIEKVNVIPFPIELNRFQGDLSRLFSVIKGQRYVLNNK